MRIPLLAIRDSIPVTYGRVVGGSLLLAVATGALLSVPPCAGGAPRWCAAVRRVDMIAWMGAVVLFSTAVLASVSLSHLTILVPDEELPRSRHSVSCTTHYSLLTTHYSPLTTHYSPPLLLTTFATHYLFYSQMDRPELEAEPGATHLLLLRLCVPVPSCSRTPHVAGG